MTDYGQFDFGLHAAPEWFQQLILIVIIGYIIITAIMKNKN